MCSTKLDKWYLINNSINQCTINKDIYFKVSVPKKLYHYVNFFSVFMFLSTEGDLYFSGDSRLWSWGCIVNSISKLLSLGTSLRTLSFVNIIKESYYFSFTVWYAFTDGLVDGLIDGLIEVLSFFYGAGSELKSSWLPRFGPLVHVSMLWSEKLSYCCLFPPDCGV